MDYKEFVDALARDTVAPAAMGKRDQQSKEAMGTDAFEMIDKQLGHGFDLKHAMANEGQTMNARKLKPGDLQRQAADAIASRFTDIRKAFKYVDLDNSGTVDEDEIRRALKMWNMPIAAEDVKRLVERCDKDNNGQINYDEFVDALARDTVAPAAMNKRGMQSKEAMGTDAFEMIDKQLGHGFDLKHAMANEGAPAMTARKLKPGELQRQAADAIASRFTDIHKAFQYVDLDGSGTVDEHEIRRALKMWNMPLAAEDVRRLVEQCDKDMNGQINYDEFVDALARDTVAPAAMNKRGMQSKDAMGTSAFEMIDAQLGHGAKTKHAYDMRDM